MGGSKVDIPKEFWIHLDPVNLSGGFDLMLSGDPIRPLTIDAGLDDVNVSLTGNPAEPVTIAAGLDNIKVSLTGNNGQPLAVDLGLDKICVSLAVTEIPRVRVHVPTRYDFGFCLFGIPIFNFTLAGETMLLTQDNPPRVVHKPARAPTPTPNPNPLPNPTVPNPSAPRVRVNLTEDDTTG
jgi:hypothetical protein